MSELLLRRRAMMLASTTPAPSEWDSVWEYTDGLPTTKGWIETAPSSSSIVLVTDGYRIRGRSYKKDTVEITHGIIEAKFTVENASVTTKNNRASLRIGNASNSVYVNFRNFNSLTHKILLNDGASADEGTEIGAFSFSEPYILRIEINGPSANVLINGIAVATNVNTSAMSSKGPLYFGNGYGNAGAIWEYVKYKNLN